MRCRACGTTTDASAMATARLPTLWSLPLLLAPPMFSRDAFSYAALGKMVVRIG